MMERILWKWMRSPGNGSHSSCEKDGSLLENVPGFEVLGTWIDEKAAEEGCRRR